MERCLPLHRLVYRYNVAREQPAEPTDVRQVILSAIPGIAAFSTTALTIRRGAKTVTPVVEPTSAPMRSLQARFARAIRQPAPQARTERRRRMNTLCRLNGPGRPAMRVALLMSGILAGCLLAIEEHVPLGMPAAALVAPIAVFPFVLAILTGVAKTTTV